MYHALDRAEMLTEFLLEIYKRMKQGVDGRIILKQNLEK